MGTEAGRWGPALARVVVGASVAGALACCGDEQQSSGGGAGQHGSTTSTAASSTSTGPEEPVEQHPSPAEPRAGWHRWDYTPIDCAVFAPDDVDAIDPVVWEPCPFMEQGCMRMVPSWPFQRFPFFLDLRVSKRPGPPLFAVSRQTAPNWAERVVAQGDRILWARAVHFEHSQCGLSHAFGPETSTFKVQRAYYDTSPLVYDHAFDRLADEQPSATHVFEEEVAPGPGIRRTDRYVVMLETQPTWWIAARDTETGQTCRSPQEEVAFVANQHAFHDVVHYVGWTGQLSSLWTHRPCSGIHRPLLRDDEHSYDAIGTDGVDLAWIRGTGFISTGKFETYELFTAPWTASAAELAPRKLADLDVSGILVNMVSVGDGWIAVKHRLVDFFLYRVADGAVRRLPRVEGVGYAGGYNSLSIHEGQVWVAAHIEGTSGNDVRWIIRFDIDALPEP